MKKLFFVFMMLMAMVMSANAQVITNVAWEDGQYWLYLDGCMRVPAAQYGTGINWQTDMTIQDNLARAQAAYQARVARRFGSYNYGCAGYPVAAYPVYGGQSSSFSIQGKKAGFSTYSSEFGGYKSSGTSVRVGEINLQMSNSGYSRQQASNYGCYGRSSSAVSQAQVKSDAKAAAKAYSMKNNGVANNGSVRNTTSASPIKATKEMNVKSFIPTGF